MAKIKNVSVDIKIGKREYKLKNLILDTLLNNYAKSLSTEFYNNQNKILSECCVSFSKKVISNNTILQAKDFDICILNKTFNTVCNGTRITNKYVCTTENNAIFDYKKMEQSSINQYVGNKIYFLGFTYWFEPSSEILAILDVSNYDIYIYENEEITITRLDEINTDAIFTSFHDNVKGPIHLLPDGIEGILPLQILWNEDNTQSITIYNNAYAKLEKVSFANKIGEHELETEIGLNYSVLNNIFTIKNIICPKLIFPNPNLFPSADLYTLVQYYKYINLHFKLYQKMAEGTFDDYELVETYTGAEYMQTFHLKEIEKEGNLEIKIKYERGE